MSIDDQKIRSYEVFVTPLVSSDVYGDEINITDYVLAAGLPRTKSGIDSADFDFGVYFYGDISLKCINFNGILNENDSRGIFPSGRDRAKVRVIFQDETTTDTNSYATFDGLLNEESTRLNVEDTIMSFKILSQDSVIRNTKVSAGTVTNGVLTSDAIKTILNVPRITSVLNYSAANINPDLDFTVDDGSHFDNLSTRDALNDLMLGTNSVMLIDSSKNMIVKSRAEDETKDVLNLFGQYDPLGRENIISIKQYNSGRHRMFTSVKVNNIEKNNAGLAQEFGTRQRSISLGYITSLSQNTETAQRLLDEFKTPKIEMLVTVPTSFARENNAEILDRVSVDYPLRIGKPESGKFLPVIGATKIGDTEAPLPRVFGSISISKNIAFKIINISEDPKSFKTTFKLRQKGTELNDGQFDDEGNSLVGFATIGVSKIAGTGITSYNPSVLGAAQIGNTKI